MCQAHTLSYVITMISKVDYYSHSTVMETRLSKESQIPSHPAILQRQTIKKCESDMSHPQIRALSTNTF